MLTISSTSFVFGEVGRKGWLWVGVADCVSNGGKSPAGGGVGPPRPCMFAVAWLASEAR
jgi:hypothetical protein